MERPPGQINGTVRRTRVQDPSTEKCETSATSPNWEWNRTFAGRWSLVYGFVLSDRDRFTFFRTDEFDVNFNDQPYATAFIESARPRTSITLDLDNALNGHGQRERLLFTPHRAQPDTVENEFRERNRHLNFGITLKRSFGGGPGVAKSN